MEIVLPEKILGIDTMLIKLFVQPIGIFLVLMILFNLAVYPKIADIGRIKQEVAKVNAEIKKIVEKVNYVNSISPEELKKNENVLGASMLYEKDAYYLVSVVRKVADKFNYSIQGFSLTPGKITKEGGSNTKEVKGNKRVPITLNMLGPKSSYLDFLKGLESSLPLLSIEEMDMKARGEISEIDLKVTAYYIDEESKPEVKKLSLADLQLNQDEAAMLTMLSAYTNNRGLLTGAQQKTATRSGVLYGRTNPFSQ
jgi:hypothetical protein